MSRTLGTIIFLTIVIAILGGLHFYVWLRLIRDPGLPAPWRGLATALIILLAVATPGVFILRRAVGDRALFKAIYWPVSIWMGVLFLLFSLLVVVDVARLGVWVASRLAGRPRLDPDRRAFLARLLGGAVAATVAGAGALAVGSALTRVQVKELRVPLRRLPRELDGTTIVQLTDVHIGGGPSLGREFIEEIVERTNALEPDIVAITGDLVDGPVADLAEAVAPLARLRAKHGVFFVTGNHEYYSGVAPWLAELTRLGIRVLRNERVEIGGERSFDLAGIDDWSSRGQARGHGPDLERALAGRDPSRELVLLAHQPRAVREAARHGVGLQLSGHTHGGQIWPWKYFVYLQQPFVAGLGREGDTWIYVSCGTGYWGPPMRLAAPAEITRVVLEAAGVERASRSDASRERRVATASTPAQRAPARRVSRRVRGESG